MTTKPDDSDKRWLESSRKSLKDWSERESNRLLEFERKLEEGGIIAYHGDEGRFTLVTATGFVLTVEMYFYPEGPFYQVNGEYPY